MPDRLPHTFVVHAADEEVRLDRFLQAGIDGISRSEIQRWIRGDLVLVDGKSVKAATRLKPGQEIIVHPPEPSKTDIIPEAIPVRVVYEDEYLVVVDKSVGMVVHPAGPRRTGTLVNALLYRYGLLRAPGAPDRPGIVHRLDKGTSGLMVVARNERAYLGLVRQISDRTVCRKYRAIVWGVMPVKQGFVDQPVGRHKANRKKMTVTDTGKRAVTLFSTRKTWDIATELEISLQTGRTHQIRVHLQWSSHPVVGDSEYGGRLSGINRLPVGFRRKARALLEHLSRPALHSWRLAFVHPITGELLAFEAEPPSDYLGLIDFLVQGQQTHRG